MNNKIGKLLWNNTAFWKHQIHCVNSPCHILFCLFYLDASDLENRLDLVWVTAEESILGKAMLPTDSIAARIEPALSHLLKKEFQEYVLRLAAWKSLPKLDPHISYLYTAIHAPNYQRLFFILKDEMKPDPRLNLYLAVMELSFTENFRPVEDQFFGFFQRKYNQRNYANYITLPDYSPLWSRPLKT